MGFRRKIQSFIADYQVVVLVVMIPVILLLFRSLLLISYYLTGSFLLGVILVFLAIFCIALILKPADLRRQI